MNCEGYRLTENENEARIKTRGQGIPKWFEGEIKAVLEDGAYYKIDWKDGHEVDWENENVQDFNPLK